MADKRGRPPHEIDTVEFKITTTRVVQDHLKQLVETGYFGKSHNEAAEQLVRERLRQIASSEEVATLAGSAKRQKK